MSPRDTEAIPSETVATEEEAFLVASTDPSAVNEDDSPLLENDESREEAEEDTTTPSRRIYKSLARYPTTPALAAVVISVFMLLAHVLFLYAQTAPMWKLHLSQNISCWANATGKETKWAFDTLAIPHNNHFYIEDERNVQDFTYMYSVKELWQAKGWSGVFMARLTAALLILCSGVWPHLKLFLLHLTWLFPMRSAIRRKRFLHWLSTLGKWSLADVLTVCVMIGVLHLDWTVDPEAVKQGLMHELPLVLKLVHGMYSATDICTKMLKYDCTKPHKFDHIAKCKSCRTLLNEAFDHPSWAKTTGKAIMEGVSTSGGGKAELSVMGLRGIYAFCGAVIMSILLSLIVDIYDVRARRAQRRLERANSSLAETAANSSPDATAEDSLLVIEEEGQAGEAHRTVEASLQPPVSFVLRREADPIWLTVARHTVPVVVFVLVLHAMFVPTMIRKAEGAIPSVLMEILGVDWTRPYSLNTLMQTTGFAGRWDILLMSTFGLFLLVGPALRALLCVFAVSNLVQERWRIFFGTAIDFIGAFCAWEIIAVAIVMTGMLMPNITNTIITNPNCALADPEGKCLEVFFDTVPTFWLLVAGGFSLVGVSVFASHSGRVIEEEHEAAMVCDENATTEYQRLASM